MRTRLHLLSDDLKREALQLGRRKISNLESFVIQCFANRIPRRRTKDSLVEKGISEELSQKIVDSALLKLPNDLEGEQTMDVGYLLDSSLEEPEPGEVISVGALRASILLLAIVVGAMLENFPFLRVCGVVVAIISAMSLLVWGHERILDYLDWRDRGRSDVNK